MDVFAEMTLDPRFPETQLFSQCRENLVEEDAVLVHALYDKRRRLLFETFPDSFDRIEVGRANREEHEIDTKLMCAVSRVCTDVCGEIV